MTQSSSKHLTRVLICGTQFPGSYIYTRKYLKQYSFIQVDNVPLNEVPKVIASYHICIVMGMKLDDNVISTANQMKLIMQYGVGLEATRYGIKVARISGGAGNADSCAEMAIYLMLSLLRKQKELQIAAQQGKLGVPVGEMLLGKTVLIMGFGNIGIGLAKCLQPFGVRILATKRSWSSQLQDPCDGVDVIDNLVDEKGTHADLHKFTSVADIVVCCLSLNNETVGTVNESFSASMKKIVGDLALQLHAGAPLTGIEFLN